MSWAFPLLPLRWVGGNGVLADGLAAQSGVCAGREGVAGVLPAATVFLGPFSLPRMRGWEVK